ncbi:hypothetical protein BH11MYX4_BH11MYX4_63150 [soil metagenome]
MKFLVVAAWEPELARFRERAGAAPIDGVELVLETLGVGIVEASLGMTRCVVRHTPEVALLIGTAGALPRADALGIGQVVVASAVRLVDAGILDGRAELPPPMPATARLDGAVHDVLVARGVKSVQIANTVGITVDDALAARLGAGDDHVEHLEAFAFARACAASSVRAGIVLGIANGVGARGHAEWLANHTRA